MISLRSIRSSDNESYQYMEDLLTNSFPVDEYRELSELKTYTDSVSHFFNTIVQYDEQSVGFVSYWNFSDFHYIEHFAIDPTLRNGGYGRKLIDFLKKKLNSPILLEVELPENETAQRRIRFYERQEFKLWKKKYMQPSYKKGSRPIPMHLMVHGGLSEKSDFEFVKNTLHKEVYGMFGESNLFI